MNNPYRTMEIPITYSERLSKIRRKVADFFKDYWVCFVLLGVMFGLLGVLAFIGHLSERSCKEGAALIKPGQVANCSSSAETIRATETAQGVLLWCECPGHEHSQDLP